MIEDFEDSDESDWEGRLSLDGCELERDQITPLNLPNFKCVGKMLDARNAERRAISGDKSQHGFRERDVDIDLIVDFGGSGVYFDDASSSWTSLKPMQDDTKLFTSRRCSLPFMASKRSFKTDIDLNAATNHNKLLFDAKRQTLLVNRSKAILSLIELTEQQDLSIPFVPSILKKEEETFADNQDPIDNFVLRESSDGRDLIFVQSNDKIRLLGYEQEQNTQSFAVKELHYVESSTLVDESVSFFEYISPNPTPGFHDEVAAAVCIRNDEGIKKIKLLNYDFTHETTKWHVIGAGSSDVLSILPTSLYCAVDHPRRLFYQDTRFFGVFDTRIPDESSYSRILSQKETSTVFDWEYFRAAVPFPNRPRQHILLTDYHIAIIDERFPGAIIIQWAHSLEISKTNRLRFIKASTLKENSHNYTLLAASNMERICLLTVEESSLSEINQPTSLHTPLHTSHPSDSIDFGMDQAMRISGSVERRFRTSQYCGMEVVPTKAGFSLFTLTDYKDIFVQDFYFTEVSAQMTFGTEDASWSSGPGSASLELDEVAKDYLESKCKDIGAQDYSRHLSDIGEDDDDELCKCCEDLTITGDKVQHSMQLQTTDPQVPKQEDLLAQSRLVFKKYKEIFGTGDETELGLDKENTTAGSHQRPDWEELTQKLLKPWDVTINGAADEASGMEPEF